MSAVLPEFVVAAGLAIPVQRESSNLLAQSGLTTLAPKVCFQCQAVKTADLNPLSGKLKFPDLLQFGTHCLANSGWRA